MRLLGLTMNNGAKICNFRNNFIFIKLLYINLYIIICTLYIKDLLHIKEYF